MFKFNIPISIIVSSGGLILLVIGSLLLVTNTAHTSDVQAPEMRSSINETAFNLDAIESVTPAATATESTRKEQAQPPRESRGRGARLYSGSNAYGTSQQPSALDNYGSAYSSGAADQSSGLIQSTVQANDASSFASFGEPPPSSASSPAVGSSSRQVSASEQSPQSSYYAGYMSPSTNSASYVGGGQQSGANNYHSMSYLYPQYPKNSAIPPPGYPSNNYDRQLPANYYDRSYLTASSTPLWAQTSTSGGLMTSASNALSHWTGGFGISEIICGVIAISIGAIILGAPFFLIYLALMGNFSGSGSLSLTNPNQSTTPAPANGRRKRLAVIDELNSIAGGQDKNQFGALARSMIRQLSPLIDLDQLTSSFRKLVNSIEKYSHMEPEMNDKKRS